MEQVRQNSDCSDVPGQAWAETVDDDPWWPCILALDGGGIKGYSSLLILKELMSAVWDWEQYYTALDNVSDQVRSGATGDDDFPSSAVNLENGAAVSGSLYTPVLSERVGSLQENKFLPCHYFDFMYGTSTGGLIATILGRLRMTIDEGLDLYREVGQHLFGRRRSYIPGMTKYYHQPLEKAVRGTVGSLCREHDPCNGEHRYARETTETSITLNVHEPRVCHSCCLAAVDRESELLWLLRSYPLQYGPDTFDWITKYNSGACPLSIHLVARATTAAPFFFKMVKTVIDGDEVKFKDGGMRENNPSGAAHNEFITLYKEENKPPALLLSIGTGLPDRSNTGFTSSKVSLFRKVLDRIALMKNMKDKFTDCEEQHQQMLKNAKGESTWYKRLNVSTGMEKMQLDSWQKGEWKNPNTNEVGIVPGGKTLSFMEKHTTAYLERGHEPDFDAYASPNYKLRQVAQKLVLHRRAREKLGGERWNTYIGNHPP